MAHFEPSLLNKKFIEFPVIPVFYHDHAALTIKILQSCYDGGMRVFEFTNRGVHAEKVFKEIYPYVRKNCPEMALGIGTIFTAAQAELFIKLGSDFIVQPVTTAEVAEVCTRHGVAWVPGAATATEIYHATKLGADLVKIFPANVLGPGFVKALKGPMPHVKLMATGGVEPTRESISAWLQAGVACVGMGSQLFPQDLIASGDFHSITAKVAALMSYVKTPVQI